MMVDATLAPSGKAHPVTGRPVCGANRDTPNKFGVYYCCTSPMPNGRCYKHGGATPGGIASPHAKHLRHSKYLPGGLLERYQQAAADPDLLNLSAEIALTDARIDDLLGRLDQGDLAGAWVKLQDAFDAFRVATVTNDSDLKAEAVADMAALIEQGTNDQLIWTQLTDLMNERRRLVQTETKRRLAMQKMISADEGMALVVALANIVRTHVHDRAILSAIQADLTRLLAQRTG
jgi:hypothetical protein